MTKTIVVLTALASLAACSSADDTEATPSPSSSASAEAGEASASPTPPRQGKRVPVTISNGSVDPQGARVEVRVGEPITLVVTSDAADELHVHSDPEHSFDVAAGTREEELTFEVENPGQVAVESHHLGVTILQLVVRP